MHNETGWLIERSIESSSMPEYIGFEGAYSAHCIDALGRFFWTADPGNAMRFARQEDAIKFIGAMRGLMEELPHRLTIKGLRRDDAFPYVRDHMWCDVQYQKHVEEDR